VNRSLRVVVVGAGIGGLGSALALARAGHEVILVERDDTPMPADVEGAFEWERRGAPQVRHPHVFLGLAHTILRDRYPDVSTALSELGVSPSKPGSNSEMGIDEATLALLVADEDLRMIPCRRTTFEWVMRRQAIVEAGVDIRVGHGVTGVRLRDGVDGPPVVCGVELDDGSVLDADLVVATTGRRGDVPAWLAVHGIEVPEISGDTGVVYFSRFYRSDHDEDFGFRGGFGAGLIAGVIGADANTFSITAVVDQNDKELRAHLNDSNRFDATMRLLPELADVAAVPAVPINPVHCMTGLINRHRRFVDDSGAPLVVGLMACGDAHTCTNPAYGRGQSLALLQATMITDAVEAATDLAEAARAYEGACVERVEPWYHFSVLTDQMRSMVTPGAGSSRSDGGGSGFELAALFSSVTDPEMIHTVVRVMNLLDPPTALVELMPLLQGAPKRTPEGERPRRPRTKRPSRDDLLAVVA
jgi:2-polyprenyl-6-methoxyphenol hydroxylase-like FAD-dependent oxidoreductase